MTKLMFILLACLALVMVVAVLAYQYAGIWGLLGAIVAVFIALRFVPKILQFMMMRWMKKMVDAQGEALRGASIEVHAIQPASEPDPGEYQEEDFFDYEHGEWEGDPEIDSDEQIPIDPSLQEMFYHGPRNWYYVDMTVFPAMRSDGRATEYKPWNPTAINVLGPERPAPPGMPMGLGYLNIMDGFANTVKASVWRDGAWTEDDEGELFGPQRIRLHIGVKPGERRLRVAYVGEMIGEIEMTMND